MQLIGMLDSPYVRRCAISLRVLGLDFEHRPLSVFRNFEEFAGINPVVKAPTLVCDDGTVLMDSNLILELAEDLAAASGASLMPAPGPERIRAWRVIGLALAACEKSISIVYEHQLRPPEKQHEPWMERVRGQLLAACTALEAEARAGHLGHAGVQSGITPAVTWGFLQLMLPDLVVAGEYPVWRAFSDAAEQRAEFLATPQQ